MKRPSFFYDPIDQIKKEKSYGIMAHKFNIPTIYNNKISLKIREIGNY